MSDSTSWKSTPTNSYNLQSQWHVVSILYHEMKNQLTRKVGFEGTQKIGPVLEVTTSYLQSKHGVEIRIDSVNKDNSHSWVRISHRLNKLVTDLSNNKEDDINEQETSEMQFEDFALKKNVLDFASRSKAKAKPRKRTSASSSTRTVPIGERSWTDIEPETYSHIAYQWRKRLNTLLRHGQLPREEDGAIEFWRLKDCLRNKFEYSQYWSHDVWKSKMAGGGGHKKRFQYCTDPSGQEILYLRALQGHSGRNPIDPTLQDNVSIPNNFFEYILPYRLCSQFTLHHKFRIDSGRTKFKQGKTDGILYSRESSQGSAAAWFDQTTSCIVQAKGEKAPKYGVPGHWSSIRRDRTQSSSTIHSQPIVSRRWSWWDLEKSYTRKYMNHLDHRRRFPMKIIGWKNWILKSLGSSKDAQQIQPKTKTQLSRTVRPVGRQESTKKIEKRTMFDHEDVKHSTSTARPACGSESTKSCVLTPTKIEDDQTRTGRPVKVEEHNSDFRVPGLSHAVVKEAEHLRVQELVKKIESHPHREALQADLQQNNVSNPFSKNSKAMIRE